MDFSFCLVLWLINQTEGIKHSNIQWVKHVCSTRLVRETLFRLCVAVQDPGSSVHILPSAQLVDLGFGFSW